MPYKIHFWIISLRRNKTKWVSFLLPLSHIWWKEKFFPANTLQSYIISSTNNQQKIWKAKFHSITTYRLYESHQLEWFDDLDWKVEWWPDLSPGSSPWWLVVLSDHVEDHGGWPHRPKSAPPGWLPADQYWGSVTKKKAITLSMQLHQWINIKHEVFSLCKSCNSPHCKFCWGKKILLTL